MQYLAVWNILKKNLFYISVNWFFPLIPANVTSDKFTGHDKAFYPFSRSRTEVQFISHFFDFSFRNSIDVHTTSPSHRHCCRMGTAIKHPVPDRVKLSFAIFDIRGTLTLRTKRQSARMSKITNDGFTRSGTGCSIAVPIRQLWASKG